MTDKLHKSNTVKDEPAAKTKAQMKQDLVNATCKLKSECLKVFNRRGWHR